VLQGDNCVKLLGTVYLKQETILYMGMCSIKYSLSGNDQLDTQLLYFIICLLQFSTFF